MSAATQGPPPAEETPGDDGGIEEPLTLREFALDQDRLRRLSSLRCPESPLPGVLDPRPSLHILGGKPKSGKTTFGCHFATAWAEGVSPWQGAPKLPGERALIISAEQDVQPLYVRIRSTVVGTGLGSEERFDKRLLIHGQLSRDECEDLGVRDPSSIMAGGLSTKVLAQLAEMLETERRNGEPITFVLVDSLSRVLPPGFSENDAADMSRFLDALQKIAVHFQAYVVLIHHETKGTSGDILKDMRGSGAIGAVARVLWGWSRVKNKPQQRRMRTMGNGIIGRDITFEVCEASDSGEDRIDFFRVGLSDLEAHTVAVVVSSGEALSLNEIAHRVDERRRPDKLAELREEKKRWNNSGLRGSVEKVLQAGKGIWVERREDGKWAATGTAAGIGAQQQQEDF